jgi:uncharacterized membrane protein YbaN (DUF454 family)
MVSEGNSAPKKVRVSSSRVKRGGYIVAGTFFLIIGIIGIILPILPTTPFLLLTAYCYARGSKKLHHWLLTNKWCGKYISDYQDGKGIPMKAKVVAIIVLWATILFSVYYILTIIYIQITLLLIATFVTIHLLTIPTRR